MPQLIDDDEHEAITKIYEVLSTRISENPNVDPTFRDVILLHYALYKEIAKVSRPWEPFMIPSNDEWAVDVRLRKGAIVNLVGTLQDIDYYQFPEKHEPQPFDFEESEEKILQRDKYLRIIEFIYPEDSEVKEYEQSEKGEKDDKDKAIEGNNGTEIDEDQEDGTRKREKALRMVENIFSNCIHPTLQDATSYEKLLFEVGRQTWLIYVSTFRYSGAAQRRQEIQALDHRST